jgi:hypothetical protein
MAGFRSTTRLWLAAALATGLAGPLAATTLSDPAGDLLASFIGPANGDLDILSVTARYSGTNILVSSIHGAAIGTTVGSFVVWGIDRGAGTPRLMSGVPPLGDGILLDAIIGLRANGTGFVTTFPAVGAPTTTVLPASAITIADNRISGVVPLSLLPGSGFAVADYGYNMWSRSPGMNNPFIADFAPDNSSFRASFVPEAPTWAMLIAGFGIVGIAARTRQRSIA